jgi:hypothetical protein
MALVGGHWLYNSDPYAKEGHPRVVHEKMPSTLAIRGYVFSMCFIRSRCRMSASGRNPPFSTLDKHPFSLQRPDGIALLILQLSTPFLLLLAAQSSLTIRFFFSVSDE